MRINWNNVEVYTNEIVDGFSVDGLDVMNAEAVIKMAARRGVIAAFRQTGETGSGRGIFQVAPVR